MNCEKGTYRIELCGCFFLNRPEITAARRGDIYVVYILRTMQFTGEKACINNNCD